MERAQQRIVVLLAIFFKCIIGMNANRLEHCKVVVVGSGPAGLLASHALLGRSKRDYHVSIFESKEDPRVTQNGPRAYSLGLNIRGQTAIKYFDKPSRSYGLWNEIFSRGVESDSFFVHVGTRKFQIRKPSEISGESKQSNNADFVPPTLLIPRNKLSDAMVTVLEKLYVPTGRLSLNFGTKVDEIDFENRVVLINGTPHPYDILIGADGVQSTVRNSLLKHTSRDESTKDARSSADGELVVDEAVLPGFFKVMQQECPTALEADAVHAMENGKAGYGLFLIPAPLNRTCALLNWQKEDEPPIFEREDVTIEDVQEHIATHYPAFGRPSTAAIAQLKVQQPSNSRTVRCSRYHDTAAGVLLLGDAAHSTGGTLGQGANSALLDVVALDKCLDDCQDDIAPALKLFSQRQVPEGLALWSLLQLRPTGIWGVVFQGSQLLQGILFKFFPKLITKPVQISLSQTLTPFSEIVREYQFWVDKCLKDKIIIQPNS